VTDSLLGLDAIDWPRLHDAYGSAVGTPSLLRRLVERNEASEALYERWGTVWHQGTVYDCTPTAVVFTARTPCSRPVPA